LQHSWLLHTQIVVEIGAAAFPFYMISINIVSTMLESPEF